MTLVKPSNSKFEILRGTAVLEIAKIEKRAKVTLSYQGAKVSVLEAGLYKVDTDPAGLSVFKGKALVSVGGRRVEIGVGETLSLNRALTKTSFELATNNGLDQWREWRARHGAPGFGVPIPGGGRIMPRGGSGALSLIPFGDPANRSPSGWTRFPAGGRGGGGGGGPQIARSTGGTVFVNDHPVNPGEEAPQRIKDGDTIRTTQGRVEISLTGRSSLWAGENSSVRIQQVWMFMARLELLGGTAVLEQDFENSSVTFVWQDATISILEPGLYRLDANPAVLRVFEGSAEVEVAGRKVEVLKGKMLNLDGSWALIKFNRGKTDSFGLWRARRSEQTRRTPYTL